MLGSVCASITSRASSVVASNVTVRYFPVDAGALDGWWEIVVAHHLDRVDRILVREVGAPLRTAGSTTVSLCLAGSCQLASSGSQDADLGLYAASEPTHVNHQMPVAGMRNDDMTR